MTREEAAKMADSMIEEMLRSGDPEIFEAARDPDGRIDMVKLVSSAMSARPRIIEMLMREESTAQQ